MSLLIPLMILHKPDYQRIVETLGVLGLDIGSDPDSARAMIEAYRSEGKAQAHRERLEAMAAEEALAEALNRTKRPDIVLDPETAKMIADAPVPDMSPVNWRAVKGLARSLHATLQASDKERATLHKMVKACSDALGVPMVAKPSMEGLAELVEGVCGRLIRLERFAEAVEAKGSQATTETRWEQALDDIRLVVAAALFEPTAPTNDPNDIVRLVRRLVEAHAATKTTLWEAAKASAMALLTDMDRAKTDPEGVIREAAGLAAQGRCALDTLKIITDLNNGERKPTQADAYAYEGAAKHADRDGRHLMAAADRAVAHFERLLMVYADRDEQARRDRAEDYKVIALHQGIAKNLGDLINTTQDQLDRLGVPRLPAPLDKYIWLRIQVMAAMRQRIIVGLDHGAGPDKSVWTVASVK